MVTKKPKGLGRGLEALLGPAAFADDGSDRGGTPDTGGRAPREPTELRLDQMVAGAYQPRTRMDEGALYELAESIKAQGIMQPILVRRLAAEAAAATETGEAEFEIIAGERRFRAARLAGLDRVPVLVRDVPNETAAAMALIENMQREDLNPLEEAQGLQRLVSEFGLTHEAAAQAVGRSRSAASNLLRLLNLAEPAQAMLMAGDIDMGHARALLSLDRAVQITAANQIAGRKLSVREAEALVKKMAADFGAAPAIARHGVAAAAAPDKSRDVQRVEEELADLFAAEVEIRLDKRRKRTGGGVGAGAGKVEQGGALVVRFASLEALDGVIERLRRTA